MKSSPEINSRFKNILAAAGAKEFIPSKDGLALSDEHLTTLNNFIERLTNIEEILMQTKLKALSGTERVRSLESQLSTKEVHLSALEVLRIMLPQSTIINN